MVPRFKKPPKFTDKPLKKEEFLAEHNKLSSPQLKATLQLLSRFESEKAILCKNGNWSVEKIRRPFIMWLTSMSQKEIKTINQQI
jgi:hypothetical protein